MSETLQPPLDPLCQHARLMAQYNTWMNNKLYASAAVLSPQALSAPRGAFFGSILGTLNHLAVGDTLWLQRFATHPAQHAALDPVRRLAPPAALNAQLFDQLDALRAYRLLLDGVIEAWAAELTPRDLAQSLHYRNTKGVPQHKPFFSLLMHFFNHQTHHRGQITTLLFQAGQDPGVTDLLACIADVPPDAAD